MRDLTTADFLLRLRQLDIEVDLAGERLKVNAPKGAVTGEVLEELKRRKDQLVEFLAQAGVAGSPQAPPLLRVDREGEIPLSFAQQRLWFLTQLEPESPFFNVPGAIDCEGPLDRAALEGAIEAMEGRHEALRTLFPSRDGRPRQRIVEPGRFRLEHRDLSDLPDDERPAELDRLAAELVEATMDLETGPLWRACLVRLAPERHRILFSTHHIISDDASSGILVSELLTVYGAFARGAPFPLAELPVQYADFAVWQRRWLRGEVLRSQLDYWSRRLDGGKVPLLALPTDRPRPKIQGHRGGAATLPFPPATAQRLRELARAEGVTLFMVLVAGLEVLLHRYSGQEDFTLGTPITSRSRQELESLVGIFTNTLVLRADPSGDPSFRELLQRVRTDALGAYEHQDLPFEKLVEELRPQRDLSHAPLFQVLVALDTAAGESWELPGSADGGGRNVVFTTVAAHKEFANFDLSLYVAQRDDFLTGALEYTADLFDPETADRMLAHYIRALEAAASHPLRPISELDLLSATERRQLLVELNDTAGRPAPECRLHDLFRRSAAAHPERIALVCEGRSSTYGELDQRVGRIAARLREHGVRRGDRVGLCLKRSENLVAALLAVLQVGAAYVPMDPAFPADRLTLMAEDSEVALIVTEKALEATAPSSAARLFLDAEPDDPDPETQRIDGGAGPSDLAYVIYTSGSTGRPKGVAVEHASAVSFLAAMAREPGLTPDDRFLAVTTLSFDISLLEIFLPLSVGARVVIATQETATSGALLLREIESEGATVMQATPATWRMVLTALDDDRRLPSKLLCGGEALPGELARELLARGSELWNLYGPTEATVWATSHRVREADTAATVVTIGRPIDRLRLYVLDHRYQPCPTGVPGDLYLGGDGLARGYLGMPLLTAERFLPDPWSSRPGARMYQTGDLARVRTDGTVEFLGRTDFQVKVRGFRIELGEIESVLASHPRVAQGVVVARDDERGDPRLVAYVVPDGEAPSLSDVRAFLAPSLPDYMAPSALVTLDALPLTPNRKVDRKALPNPEGEVAAAVEYVAPRDPHEALLARVWSEALQREKVGIYDNFFDIGGHSLLAMEVVAKLERMTGVLIHPMDVFTHTLAQLAATFEERGARLPESGSGTSAEPETSDRSTSLDR